MTGEIRNPVLWKDIVSDITKAEEDFADCLMQGKPCFLGNAAPKAQESGPHNTIRSEVIRFFAYGGDEVKFILGSTIELHGAWIDGDIYLTDASIRFGLRLRSCHIDGHIYAAGMECRQLTLDNSCLTKEFVGDGMRIVGNLHMRRFTAHSPVSLPGAHISKNLDMSDSRFCGQQRPVIIADGAKIDGNVFMANEFIATGDVRLISVQIGGHLDCSKGRFHATEQAALLADGICVGSNVWLHKGFTAIGSVRFIGANIGGDLHCDNAKIIATQGHSLDADKLTTGGDVLLDKGFWSVGTVRLISAQIGGDFACVEGRFNTGIQLRESLILDKANIKGVLYWRNLHPESNGIVTFTSARVSAISDSPESWNFFTWRLNGFVYDAFSGDETPIDASSRLVWLGNRPSGVRFSSQPYEQVAKILRAMGKDIDAWDIEREKRELERAERKNNNAFKIPPWRRLWGRGVDALTDFVYRPWKTVMWAAIIICASAFLFNFADKSGRMAPHQPIVVTDWDYQMEAFPQCVEFQCPSERRPTKVVLRLFPDYPEFNALVYSADVFIPFFALHQESYWYPNPSDADREILFRTLLLWYWLEIIAGWILTSLFLLSATGLLRPRQSSGEKN